MGNNCSCKVCIVSCIDKYADCKDYINKEGKYNEKKPSEIKISTSINIQNILRTITIETEMKRNEVPKPEIKEAVQNPVVETKVVETKVVETKVVETKVVEASKPTISNESTPLNLAKVETINTPFVKKNNKNSEDEFEIL
jgi:hypothetical protein